MKGIRMAGMRVWIPRSDVPRIAQRLRTRRKASAMTQDDLAVRAGVAKPALVHWEKGRLPHTVAPATVNALEAALQVPPGWLLGPEAQPLPDPEFNAADAVAREGEGDRETRIPPSRCREIGPHARRLRSELGLSVAEVARACHVSRPTLLRWEKGTFPRALTVVRLRAWERALLLAPGQLLAPPASHPGVGDGRWRVTIGTETLEAAIHRVAACLATRGRNLLGPEQPLDAKAARDADVLAHRYGVGAHRWPLVDVAVSYGIDPSHARQTVARMVARAAGFAFRIPVLDDMLAVGAAGFSFTTAVSDGRMRDLLGPSLSMEHAAAFAGEILSRRITGADPGMAMAGTRRPAKAANASLAADVVCEGTRPAFNRSQVAQGA
ncbi:helix-turn-helix domain-containing protein [Paraburkholderia sp. CI3]|uniref:helix-turn-helix domain-containing protein n=1 Tax=Paraburkholderia sp. CI3 TaxID=2991060 RepID=UPI003D1A34F8